MEGDEDYSAARFVFRLAGFAAAGVMFFAGLAFVMGAAGYLAAGERAGAQSLAWLVAGGGAFGAALMVWLTCTIGRAICDIAAATARIAEITERVAGPAPSQRPAPRAGQAPARPSR